MKIKQSIFYTILIMVFVSTSCSKESALPEKEYVDTTINAIVQPEVGGSNEPNQVYFDLRTNTATSVKRDAWDFGFYSGDAYRVILNPSIKMAVKKLETTDINAVNTASVSDFFGEVAVGTFDASNVVYVDSFDGDIQETAIEQVSINDAENHVYLVNMGYAVSTAVSTPGSVNVNGEARGWKKIRVLQHNGEYLLQYADLDDTSYNEYFIPKNNLYNFTFFSFNTENSLNVEPEKDQWDMCFTVFTNEFPGYGTYQFSDFITTNYLQEVMSYKVVESDILNYSNFTMQNLDETLLNVSQRNIGSSWRSGGGPNMSPAIYNDRMYIIKDTEGSYYKLKFTALTDTNGERGFPKFEFQTIPLE